jgi:hypothetical protein
MTTFEKAINAAHSRAYFVDTVKATIVTDFLENLVVAMVTMLILKANERFRVGSPGTRVLLLMLVLPVVFSVVLERTGFACRPQPLWPFGLLGDAFGPRIGALIGMGSSIIQSLLTSNALCNDAGASCTATFSLVRLAFAALDLLVCPGLWVKALLVMVMVLYIAPWIWRAARDRRARHIRRNNLGLPRPWYIVLLLTQPAFGAPLSRTTYYPIVSVYPSLQ